MEITAITVTQLNRQIRIFLEQDMGEISVIGELSNLAKPASGHLYFTLKDNLAQLKCAFFRNYHTGLKHTFAEGQQVIARGLVSLYETRGEYQLIVYELTPYGLGELNRQFELLKEKLTQQGLFAPDRKRPLPRFPERIAVITSQHGAALHDILITLKRRYPLVEVDIYPCDVQGSKAAPQIIKRLGEVNHNLSRPCNLIILARGGGSLEDLWAFNDEQLAQAIYLSKLPVVTGVGHESDFTIADFVADLRAATPTAAAESATPNQDELQALLKTHITRMTYALQRLIVQHKMTITHLYSKLDYLTRLIQSQTQTLDYLQRQLQQLMQQKLTRSKHRIDLTLTHLKALSPELKLEQTRSQLQSLNSRLGSAIHNQLHQLKKTLATRLATLDAVSPLATLGRGYAIASHKHHVLYDSKTIRCGDSVDVRLARGLLICEVMEINSLTLGEK